MKNACLLLILCLLFLSPTFWDIRAVAQSSAETTTKTITQINQVTEQRSDTLKKASNNIKEVKNQKKEKISESGEFEFFTKLPVVKTFIVGIESIVKGFTKLVN